MPGGSIDGLHVLSSQWYAAGSVISVERWAATNMGGHCQPHPSSPASAGPGKQPLCRLQFWIGAATTAAERGIPDSIIKVLGRWKSDAFQTYIRMPRPVVGVVIWTAVSSYMFNLDNTGIFKP